MPNSNQHGQMPQQMLGPPQMTPEQERANLCVILLERIKPDEKEAEVLAMRATAAKIVDDFLKKPLVEQPPEGDFGAIWTPPGKEVAQA